MSKKCGKFILKDSIWINDECNRCCSDCNKNCDLVCPLYEDGSCDRCEFKNGFKKPF